MASKVSMFVIICIVGLIALEISAMPAHAHRRIITNNNEGVSIIQGNGMVRTVTSGRTPDGELYVRNIEERYKGNVIFHNETSFNPKTLATERIRWKLDLTTPDSKPEILTDEQ